MMKKRHLFLTLLLMLPMVAQAYLVVQHSTIPYTDEEKKPFGISLDSTVSSSLTKPASYHHNVEATFTLTSNYTFKNKFKLTLETGVEKELDGLLLNNLTDTTLVLSRPIMKSKDVWKMVGKVGVVAPTDEDRRDFDSFRGSIKAGTGLSYDFKKVGLEGLTATWKFGATRNFYKYTHGRLGINSQFGISNGLKLSYKLEEFTFSGGVTYLTAWSYSNTRKNDKYSLSASVNYQPTGALEWLSITGGYMNKASAFKPNGRDANFELFDTLTSSVYLSLAASY